MENNLVKRMAAPIKKVVFPIAITGVIADVISQSPYRGILPDFYEEQAGSFAIPFLLTTIVNLVGKFVESEGIDKESKAMQKIGYGLRTLGTAFVLGLNTGVEGQFIKSYRLLKENLPDFAVGMLAIGLGYIVANYIGPKISKGKEIAPPSI